jgi:hypothetical protein
MAAIEESAKTPVNINPKNPGPPWIPNASYILLIISWIWLVLYHGIIISKISLVSTQTVGK